MGNIKRGQIISYGAGERKRKMKQLLRTTELIKAIKEVEDVENSTAPSEELHRKRILLQSEYDVLTS